MVKQRRIIKNNNDEETLLIVSKPVDISCKKLTKLKPLPLEAARTCRVGGSAIRQSNDRKYLSRSVWLNNNKLTNIRGLDVLVDSLIDFPDELAWLDLSYNYIAEIDKIITKFTNLRILYLHGNCISNISEVGRLKVLTRLKSLTLHGNPISNISYYRGFVMGLLPQIKTLDFVPILKVEKLEAKPAQLVKLLKKEEKSSDT